jgi:diadenosine tetraphosphate (Ap4A) HIT family hydrolase
MRTHPPGWQVLEATDLTLSVLTITQFEVGQSLVIPRRHAPTLLDLSEEECVAIMAAARRLMRAMLDSLQPLGVLLYQNNGVWSGQEVPHFHLHVVPRSPGSDWGVGPPQVARLEASERLPRRATDEALRATAERIRPYLSGLRGSGLA